MRTVAALAIGLCVLAGDPGLGLIDGRAAPADPGFSKVERIALRDLSASPETGVLHGTPDDPEKGALPAAAPVRLDVAALDTHGRYVDNLKASEFEVTVDGTPQPVEAVTAIRIDPASSADDNGRPFAIFLDEYHTSREGADRVRAVLEGFIDDVAGPQDPIAVMKPLDSLFAIPVERDRATVREAVRTFAGRRGDYAPRTAFETEFMGRSPATIERLRRQVTVSALNALAVRLGGLTPGRKAILFVSEGFQPPAPARGEEALPTVQSLVRTANRHNVAIYPVNPSAETADAAILQTIAASTDGQTASLDDLDAALRRMVADSTAYYLLTCRPAVAADGRFHPVQVRVKRAGVRVRTRDGFWAVAAEEPLRAARASEAAARAALFDMAPRHISPLISPWFGMARGGDGKTMITFVWEPRRRVPGDRSRAATPSRIAIKATTPDGSTAFEGIVQPTGAVAESRDRLASAIFEVPPGRLRLHMSITGDDSKELDFDSRDLAVRDLRQPVAIATPAILRARNALEFRTIAADLDAAPVASREFSRAERLLIRFAAYAPAGDPVLASARLLSRNGKTMRTLEASAIAGRPELRQIDLPLAAFAPGEYLIELAVSARAGAAKELINFRVTG